MGRRAGAVGDIDRLRLLLSTRRAELGLGRAGGRADRRGDRRRGPCGRAGWARAGRRGAGRRPVALTAIEQLVAQRREDARKVIERLEIALGERLRADALDALRRASPCSPIAASTISKFFAHPPETSAR